MSIYWSRGQVSYSMWVYYNGGSYRYSDFSALDEGIERANTDEGNLIKLLEKLISSSLREQFLIGLMIEIIKEYMNGL